MAEQPYRELIVTSGVNELFFDGNCDGERAICWTRLTSDDASWIIAVSNGNDIWRNAFEWPDLESQCELSGVETVENYLEIVKNSFETGNVSMLKVGNKVLLQCSEGTTTINFDLQEAKISERKIELPFIMFYLTDKMKNLENSLADAKKDLEGQKSKEKNLDIQSFGFEPTRKAGQAANVRRKHGHSLVNPNSKKAKRAKGISFE